MTKFLSIITLIITLFVVTSSVAFAQCNPALDPTCTGPIDPSDTSGIGTITPPAGTVPTAGSDPSSLVASVVKSIVTFFLVIAFIIAIIWNILAGLQFITANGDPKAISTAWSRIYWGIIGLVVVVSSFAIIKMVELFFGVSIISEGLKLPRI